MTAPAFVGAGPVAYDATTAWPTSLAASDSTPVGVQNGDRVVCFVTTFADDTMTVSLNAPTNWTVVDYAQLNQPGQHIGLWVFTARWGPDTKDSLVAPTSATTTGRSWRLQCAAWRPSKPVNLSVSPPAHAITSNLNNFTFSAGPIQNGFGTYGGGGTVVMAQVTRNGSFTGALPSFFSSLPYTLQVDQAAVASRGGAFRVVDGVTTGNYTSSSGVYDRSFTGQTLSMAALFVIEAAEFDPPVVTGWSVDRIRY